MSLIVITFFSRRLESWRFLYNQLSDRGRDYVGTKVKMIANTYYLKCLVTFVPPYRTALTS